MSWKLKNRYSVDTHPIPWRPCWLELCLFCEVIWSSWQIFLTWDLVYKGFLRREMAGWQWRGHKMPVSLGQCAIQFFLGQIKIYFLPGHLWIHFLLSHLRIHFLLWINFLLGQLRIHILLVQLRIQFSLGLHFLLGQLGIQFSQGQPAIQK